MLPHPQQSKLIDFSVIDCDECLLTLCSIVCYFIEIIRCRGCKVIVHMQLDICSHVGHYWYQLSVSVVTSDSCACQFYFVYFPCIPPPPLSLTKLHFFCGHKADILFHLLHTKCTIPHCSSHVPLNVTVIYHHVPLMLQLFIIKCSIRVDEDSDE